LRKTWLQEVTEIDVDRSVTCSIAKISFQESLEKQLQRLEANLKEMDDQSETKLNERLDVKLKELSEQLEAKLKEQLEAKLKEQSKQLQTKPSVQLEAKLKEQSRQFQEAVKPLSECCKVCTMIIQAANRPLSHKQKYAIKISYSFLF